MGKAPAVIIVARHGARLDQADQQWHLTSPTPYDPPLTYGGWIQARALGARIGGILRAREEEQEEVRDNGAIGSISEQTGQKRKRKHKIIIHSSPFIRCVQTSVAIAAGIGQFQGRVPPVAKHHAMHSRSPHVQAIDHVPGLSAIQDPAEGLPPSPSPPESSSPSSNPESARSATSAPAGHYQHKKHRIAELRLDAFLGEWLSPDYFENITPPPGSLMMVAGAKADLLRPGEVIEGSNQGRTARGNFPGGWSPDWSPTGSTEESEEKTGLANMATLGHALSNRTRSSTQGSESPGSDSFRPHPTKLNTSLISSNANNDLGYLPPTPTYAISSSDPIPVGYVAHARDACIDVAYQWDSMRAPQCWGNGGEYGEEWSSMHRRFRNGLSKMLEWYKQHGTAVNKAAEMFVDPIVEEQTDTVVILVTHGAGCNALLGALTDQPVLLDVGMASLTMAVRKEGLMRNASGKRTGEDSEATNSTSPNLPSASVKRDSRRGSIDLGIAAEYEMIYTASTEHLRTGSSPLGAGTAVSSRTGPSPFNSPYRRPATSFSGDGFTIGEGLSAPFFTGPIGRSMTVGAASSGSGASHRNTNGHSALRSTVYQYPAVSSAPKVSSGLWRSGTSLSSNNMEGSASESGGETDNMPNLKRVSGNGRTNVNASTTDTGTSMTLKNGNTNGANDHPRLNSKRADHDAARDVKNEQTTQQQEQQRPQSQSQSKSQVNENHPGNRASSPAIPSEPAKAPPHPHSHPHMYPPAPTSTANQKGLWGGESVKDPNMAKRRWTFVESTAA